MTVGLFHNVSDKVRKGLVLAIAAAAGVAGFTGAANADEQRYGDRWGRDYRHGDERRYDRVDRHDHDHDRKDFGFGIDFNFSTQPRFVERRVKYWVEPAYRVERQRVWVEPVYRVESQRVWVAPVHQTVYDVVTVPARYEIREVVHYQNGRRHVHRERVLVEPACTRRVAREVCVTPGRWENVEKRICVTEGRWDTVEKRICVSEGRWDYRVERVAVNDRPDYGRVSLKF